MLEAIQTRLKGKVVILGIGNTLRADDAAGSLLARRLKDRLPFSVIDAGVSPENYLEKITQHKPDTLVIIDAVDFGGAPGEFKVLKADEIKTANLFTTHNASLALTINYLQNNLKVDIIILIIQPKSLKLSETLSPEVAEALNRLEGWFYGAVKKEG